jgi:Protein of unknown function (DUF982)
MPTPSSIPFAAVTVETETVGRLRTVASVREAAEILVVAWPAEKRGNTWRNACEAAHAALAGTLEADTARKAFILAAKQAGIFVREGRPFSR